MRVDLIDLLRSKKVCHPTIIKSVNNTASRTIRIEASGHPWWLDYKSDCGEREISFCFNGISGASFDEDILCRDDFEEDLETIYASYLEEQEWAMGAHFQIYCSSCIQNPFELYAKLDDYLTSIGSPFSAKKYLNMNKFSDLADTLSSNNFKLADGPEKVVNQICSYLRDAEVPFTVIEGRKERDDLIYVQLGTGHLICGEAYALFDE